jgi:hypothetical protein
LKDLFEDFITNNQDEEFIEVIRQKLLNMLQSSFVENILEKIQNKKLIYQNFTN